MTHDPAAPQATAPHVLDDLRARLRAFRPVPLPGGLGWRRGVDPDYLADLVGHWAHAYDWRVHEDRLRRLPWTLTATRAIHQRSARADATPVLLLHGWPDSVLRFERVLPLLTDHHVVVPCLPGFPFAAPVPGAGMSAAEMAGAVAETMAALGHDRYVVSAGDVGCDVAEELAARHPERVAALHLTDVSQHHFLTGLPDDLSETERAYVRHGRDWQAREGGYMHEQSTKPHTLAAALGDSPAGLAAWLVEKLRGWTDCDGDVESVFTRDELLTWVTAYWVTGAIGTSFTPYATAGAAPAGVTPPAVFTIFPRDLVNAPREFAERFFDVRVWREESRGGHFAAWEQPERYAAGVHDAVRLAAG
ncbi:epoxide hydrolase family protein [Spirilliplanes yamanashiensis]|uniref:Microsomal epoxide hydrolase n=1 Tax=Spirilliplanes yamanashiensis TaxID=42233 RepID=A0A8J3Y3E4_9ACTN|nr:epoxide hydrolase family protein [Spirilliplanes yamanashiensis]MDP9814072.1 pimeloyl-ACP methyl ester carboxylesterase [Spirilliplanes yamanashiensis]GIJ00948.1 microsomal epoxide hydrolase [Spirilliplanes yamanashiensis]